MTWPTSAKLIQSSTSQLVNVATNFDKVKASTQESWFKVRLFDTQLYQNRPKVEEVNFVKFETTLTKLQSGL